MIKKSLFASILLMVCGCTTMRELSPNSRPPKNIVVVIGDGMGPQQLGLLAASQRFDSTDSSTEKGLISFARTANVGAHTPFSHESPVNDSACSATQISAGCSCRPQQVGMDSNQRPCRGIMEIAHDGGKVTGVVSDSRATHATPAGFGVHEEDRGSEESIASKLAESNLDIILSGGADYFLPREGTAKAYCFGHAAGKRRDNRSLLEVFEKRGYTILCSDRDLQRATSLPVIGLFANDKMADAFVEGKGEEPTLAEMTHRALALANNPRGFVLMVEAGQIDWAGHANDAGWLLSEMHRLDRVMEVITSFANQNPETLVVVTGDHETGGFGFSYKRNDEQGSNFTYKGIPLNYGSAEQVRKLGLAQKPLRRIIHDFFEEGGSKDTPNVFRDSLFRWTGLKLSEADARKFLTCLSSHGDSVVVEPQECSLSNFYPYEEYSPSAMLGGLLAPDLNVVWSTGTHTSTPVFILAKGPGSERFSGLMETTALGSLLAEMSGS